ncbi:unnamed protein product, partial [Dicrocoelium dendriticum]
MAQWISPFTVLLFMHNLKRTATQIECNTMHLFEFFLTYSNVTNDDYAAVGMAYHSQQTETPQWIAYTVRQPIIISSVITMDIVTGRKLQSCQVRKNNAEFCCILSEQPQGDHDPPQCTDDVLVYNTNYEELEYDVIYKKRQGKIDFARSFIRFDLETSKGLVSYMSNHEGRDGRVVCPQFARRYWSQPPELADWLTNAPNPGFINWGNLVPAVPVVEFNQVHIRVFGFATTDHIYRAWQISYNPLYKDFQMTKIPWTMDTDLDTEDGLMGQLTRAIQWHPNYRQNLRGWRSTFQVKRHARAFVLLLSESLEMDEEINQLMQAWIVLDNKGRKFVWPATIQSPAIRIVGLRVMRKAVLQEGETKIFWAEKEHIRADSKVTCYKRQNFTHQYAMTKRVIVSPGKPYFEIRNLTISDSGMYKCTATSEKSPEYQFFSDYYIIVLPREMDVQNYLTQRPLKTTDPVEDNYQYVDVMNRSYFIGSNPIYVNCVYLLSTGLDNYNGYRTYRDGKALASSKMISEFHRYYATLILTVRTFEMLPDRSSDPVTTKVTCAHHYKPDLDTVKQYPLVPTQLTHINKTRTLVTAGHRPPLIVTASIWTNNPDLTERLRMSTLTLDDLYGMPHPQIPWSKVAVGVVSGSFIVLVSARGGWGSVSMCVRDTQQQQLHRWPCALTTSLLTLWANDPLLTEPELTQSHTLVAMRFQFECIMAMGRESLIFGVYNPKKDNVNMTLVEQTTHDQIEAILTQHYGEESRFGVDRHEEVSATFRLVRLLVRWHGTVYPGATVKLSWRSAQHKTEELKCFYSIDETATLVELGSEFKFSLENAESVLEVSKENVNEQDSGLYRCAPCRNCSALNEAVVYRLVVLPDLSQLRISLDYGNAPHISGSGTLEDPIRTEARHLKAICSYMAYRGLRGQFEMTHSYETAIPNSTEHFPLETQLGRKKMDVVDDYYRLVHTFVFQKPRAQEYWAYVRASCHLSFSNVTRDPLDILDASPNITVTKSIYLTYKLSRGPVILTGFMETNLTSLTAELQGNEYFSVDAVPLLRPIRESETAVTVNYTIFMGLPKGATRVWVVVHLDDDYHAYDCHLVHSTELDDSHMTTNLVSSPIFRANRGINFFRQEYACLLEIHTILLVVSTYEYMQDQSTDALDANLKYSVVTRMKNHNEMMERRHPSVTNATINLNNTTTFRAARLSIVWHASLQVGQSASMLGLQAPLANRLQCYYSRSDRGGAFLPIREYQTDYHEWNAFIFQKRLSNVQYAQSGTYKCNTSQPCVGCVPLVGIVPRQMVVLPTESVLSMKLSLEPLPSHALSVER